MSKSPVVNQIITLGLLLAFVGSAWLIVDVGVGETLDVIRGVCRRGMLPLHPALAHRTIFDCSMFQGVR